MLSLMKKHIIRVFMGAVYALIIVAPTALLALIIKYTPIDVLYPFMVGFSALIIFYCLGLLHGGGK